MSGHTEYATGDLNYSRARKLAPITAGCLIAYLQIVSIVRLWCVV